DRQPCLDLQQVFSELRDVKNGSPPCPEFVGSSERQGLLVPDLAGVLAEAEPAVAPVCSLGAAAE
ncbi:MAG: hypothetical protein ACYDD0_06900, partial [Candidatus Dormibacteria bacterium]